MYIYAAFYTPILPPFPPHTRSETTLDKERVLQTLFSSPEESTGHTWGLARVYNLIHRLCTVIANLTVVMLRVCIKDSILSLIYDIYELT